MPKLPPKTKQTAERERRYRKQLKLCGFRSWKQANRRRGELIDKKIQTGVTPADLPALQKLCDLYVAWKTNDMKGRLIRRIQRLEKRLGIDKSNARKVHEDYYRR